MKTVGIIVEYNPLHHGHVYHFEQAKQASGADAVVAIMSGHFLQRGEPALVSKWARTNMALHMGVDLVIELPVAFAAQPAEWFAYGAVSALHYSGVVDHLCFGSESGQLSSLQHTAAKLYDEPDSLQRAIRAHLKTGISYPAAYSAAVRDVIETDIDISQPNNSLGLHYLIALARLQSDIEPHTIARQKAAYNQTDITDHHFASATALRQLLMGGSLQDIAPFVPTYTLDILQQELEKGRAPMHWERFLPHLMNQLINLSAHELSEFYDMNEGLEHRIKNILPKLSYDALTFQQVLEQLKTRRYTYTKLQRTLLRIVLNHTKKALTVERLRQGVPYLRVLGFSSKGRQLLKRMKTTALVPVVTNVTKPPLQLPLASQFLDMDIRAAALYALAYPRRSSNDIFHDYYEAPLYFRGNAAKY